MPEKISKMLRASFSFDTTLLTSSQTAEPLHCSSYNLLFEVLFAVCSLSLKMHAVRLTTSVSWSYSVGLSFLS